MRRLPPVAVVHVLAILSVAAIGACPTGTEAAPFAYIPNAGDATVSVIDTSTTSVVATIPVGDRPFGVAVNATGTRVYVTHFPGHEVSVIDAATNAVTANIEVGQWPHGIAVNRAGTRVYVANYCGDTPDCRYPSATVGTVSVIDTMANAVVATIPVGPGPLGVALNPVAPRAYVSNGVNSTISVIDTDSNSVITDWFTYSLPVGLTTNASGTEVFAATSNGIFIHNPSILSPPRTISVPGGGFGFHGIALSPSGTSAYLTNRQDLLFAVDLATGLSTAFHVDPGFSGGAWGVSVTPDGEYVYVANPPANTVSIVDPTVFYGHGLSIPMITVGASPYAFGQFIAPPSACFGLPDATSCDDGNVCTSGDTCSSGTCSGTPVSGTPCDDVNGCTLNDTCVEGVCVGTPNTGSPCWEGTFCTLGTCRSGICVSFDCNDWDACTVDSCSEFSVCQHAPVGCDDDNPCTEDTCDPILGCANTVLPDATTCSDGNACNGLETCVAGTCTSGTPLDCDDHDACTDDSLCDPIGGCQHASVDCHDDGACTEDSCDTVRGCQHTPLPRSPTFLSIGCRLAAVIAEVSTTASVGAARRGLLASLTRAQAFIAKAEQSSTAVRLLIYLKRTIHRMRGFEQRVNSLTGRQRITVATREDLLAQSGPIISDVETLLLGAASLPAPGALTSAGQAQLQ